MSKASSGLFSYIGYDNSKIKDIGKSLLSQCGGCEFDALNTKLESGTDCSYFDENVKEVDCIDKAKYVVVDTGKKTRLHGRTGNVCVAIWKLGNMWTGGYVETLDKLISMFKSVEQQRTVGYMHAQKVSETVKKAKEAGKSKEEINEIVSEMNCQHAIKNVIADYVAEGIFNILWKDGSDWSANLVKELLSGTVEVVKWQLSSGEKSEIYVSDDAKRTVVINTGWLADDYRPIYVMAKMNVDGKIDVVERVDMVESNDQLSSAGFSLDSLPGLKCSKDKKFALNKIKIDFSDRARLKHCISDRAYRLKNAPEEMSDKMLREKIESSIRRAMVLEENGVDEVALAYVASEGKYQLLIPLYIECDAIEEEPNAVISLGYNDAGVWTPCTLLSNEMALHNMLVLSKYDRPLWARKMKVSEALNIKD